MTKECRICHKVKQRTLKEFALVRRITHEGTRPYRNRCRQCYKKREDEISYVNRKNLLTAYGNGKCACVCCGEKTFEFLCLDHIGGKKTRILLGHLRRNEVKDGKYCRQMASKLKQGGYPHKDKLRTLCANCNMATKFGKVCPHQIRHEVQA